MDERHSTQLTPVRPARFEFPVPAPGSEESPAGHFGLLYGASPPMRALYRQIARVAATDATVVITGESGTGKELIARTVHAMSRRRDRPFVPVNCGAIVPALIEAELFGHEKGSFTGALERHLGYLEHASGGTIFLDEITEMSPAMQVKLLHALETGRFYRVGGSEEIAVDLRVIAASHRDLDAAVRQGEFRQDLLYRLSVFPLAVPALRERRDDIELLARYFLEELNAREGTDKLLSRRALDVLRSHAWPGNVRELRNTLHRAFILADRLIEIPSASLPAAGRTAVRGGVLSIGVGTPLAEAQRELILATLQHFEGDKRRAAQTLGISLKTLYNRLELYRGDRRELATA